MITLEQLLVVHCHKLLSSSLQTLEKIDSYLFSTRNLNCHEESYIVSNQSFVKNSFYFLFLEKQNVRSVYSSGSNLVSEHFEVSLLLSSPWNVVIITTLFLKRIIIQEREGYKLLRQIGYHICFNFLLTSC